MTCNYWPDIIDWTYQESKSLLRSLETEAYAVIVSAFRAQGNLTQGKKNLLQELQSLLGISVERHRAEIRRALSDEKLCTVSAHTSGASVYPEWQIEGRRLVPLLPRIAPKTAFTSLADKNAAKQRERNSQLPKPVETGKDIYATPILASPAPPRQQPKIFMPHASGMLPMSEQLMGTLESLAASESQKSQKMVTIGTQTLPLAIGTTEVEQVPTLVRGRSSSQDTFLSSHSSLQSPPPPPPQCTDDPDIVRMHRPPLPTVCSVPRSYSQRIMVVTTASSEHFSSPALSHTSYKDMDCVAAFTYSEPLSASRMSNTIKPPFTPANRITPRKPIAHIRQQAGMKVITQSSGSVKPRMYTSPANPSMYMSTSRNPGSLGTVGSKVISLTNPRLSTTTIPTTTQPKILQIKGPGHIVRGTAGPGKPNVIVVQKSGPRRYPAPLSVSANTIPPTLSATQIVSIPRSPPSTTSQSPFEKELVSFIRRHDSQQRPVTNQTKPIERRLLTKDGTPALSTGTAQPRRITVVRHRPDGSLSQPMVLTSQSSGALFSNLMTEQQACEEDDDCIITEDNRAAASLMDGSEPQPHLGHDSSAISALLELQKSQINNDSNKPVVSVTRTHLPKPYVRGANTHQVITISRPPTYVQPTHTYSSAGGSQLVDLTPGQVIAELDPFTGRMYDTSGHLTGETQIAGITPLGEDQMTSITQLGNFIPVSSVDLQITAITSLNRKNTPVDQQGEEICQQVQEFDQLLADDQSQEQDADQQWEDTQQELLGLADEDPKNVHYHSENTTIADSPDYLKSALEQANIVLDSSDDNLVVGDHAQTEEEDLGQSSVEADMFGSNVEQQQQPMQAVTTELLKYDPNLLSVQQYTSQLLQQQHQEHPDISDRPITPDESLKRKRTVSGASGYSMDSPRVSGWRRQALGLVQRVSKFRGSHKRKGELDSAHWFTQPVDPIDVPDYYTIIEKPMDFSSIRCKLEEGAYDTWEDFDGDMLLVQANCHTYNPPDDPIRKDCDEVFAYYQEEFQRIMERSKQGLLDSPSAKKAKMEQSPF